VKKIISLFQRNYDGDRLVRDEVVPGAEWVLDGEGIATEKFDGTCCMVRSGVLFKRYDVKKGRKPPQGFEPAQDPDPVTGHWPGWVEVGDGPEDQWHREAWIDAVNTTPFSNGTYELVGPKVQGNPYALDKHELWRHGMPMALAPSKRTFDYLKGYFSTARIEGIVWHHPDGRMVKIKTKDFGLPWP